MKGVSSELPSSGTVLELNKQAIEFFREPSSLGGDFVIPYAGQSLVGSVAEPLHCARKNARGSVRMHEGA